MGFVGSVKSEAAGYGGTGKAVLLAWALLSLALLVLKWPAISTLTLGDTDDYLRLMQVRDWLVGQSWADLRQYRLNPPAGFDIHWSRLVDLPIAGLILLTKPLLGAMGAEKFAVAVAPLLPLGIVLAVVARLARQFVDQSAHWAAFAFFALAPFAMGMFAPTRIDHHGWQLAMLTLLMLGLCDPKPGRGGSIAGAATALSLTIGLEMLPFLLAGGAVLALRWVWAADEGKRLTGYGVAMGAGTLLGFWLFASNDNQLPRCDALTPVWLKTALAASFAMAALGWFKVDKPIARFAAAAGAGGTVAAFLLLTAPQCLARLEGVSPQLQALWLNQVMEARPVFRQEASAMVGMLSMPIFGLAGYGWMLWQRRADRAALMQAAPLVLLAAATFALLFFQARVATAAQLLAVPGVACGGWALLKAARGSGNMLVRVFGTVAILILPSGLPLSAALERFKAEPQNTPATESGKPIAKLDCADPKALAPISKLPTATILSFMDMGPMLITHTPHRAIAGPYHRNGEAILDVMRAFDGPADGTRAIAAKHGASLILICPSLPEANQYKRRSPSGFYAELAKGQILGWMIPIALPANSPYQLWEINKEPR